MVADVEMKTRDGYEVVWNLLYRFVPGYDPTKTVEKPSWDEHNRGVIHYAAAFDLYFRLSAKRGENHNQFTRSILFLKGITAQNLMKIVEPLLIAIEGMQRNLNDIGGMQIGYLPHHLHVSALAQWVDECCKVEPSTGISAVILGFTTLRMAMTSQPPPMTWTRTHHNMQSPLTDICRGTLSLQSHQLDVQTAYLAAGCLTQPTCGNQIPRDACDRINFASPVKPVVRWDMSLTRATFSPCQSSSNDTSRMVSRQRPPS
jgi:hypothetical protein